MSTINQCDRCGSIGALRLFSQLEFSDAGTGHPKPLDPESEDSNTAEICAGCWDDLRMFMENVQYVAPREASALKRFAQALPKERESGGTS